MDSNSFSNSCIDFYVPIIDNYGDMGFAVNLAISLHEKYQGLQIRFFSDDQGLFQMFFPESIPDWMEYRELKSLYIDDTIAPAKLIFSFFDYKVPLDYLAKFPYNKTIVVFSYFLLHEGLESLHGTKYVLGGGFDTVIHYVPSLLSGGGGIIINPLVNQKQVEREKFLGGIGKEVSDKKWISIFVYKESLPQILSEIQNNQSDSIYWICGNTTDLQESSNCRVLPFLSLVDYGVFQSMCDVNIVRGENSLCQALLVGKPVLWDIYKENNGAHREKIEDFILFLGKFFSEDVLNKYAQIFRDFNNKDNKSVLGEYIKILDEFSEGFERMGEYIRGECDLVEKLEEILKKNDHE